MNVPVVLQSRVGSKRYPGKMLEDIAGRTLLERVLIRIERTTGSPQILAIPDSPQNIPLKAIAKSRGWRVFQGSEDDVLGRYALALKKFGCERFVRATGDNPLVEPRAILGIAAALDRVTVARTSGFPKGCGSEGAHASALFEADREATTPEHREHVMPFLYAYPERYKHEEIVAPAAIRGDVRLTVDTAEDIERSRAIFKKFGDHPVLEDVLEYISGKY